MKQKQFGKDWSDGQLNFPKHLTPKIIHSALFIYNADCKEETITRINYVAKQIGDKAMAYAMSLLVLPTLMEMTRDTEEYKTFLEDKNNRILN
jgi:hypothetical protein